MVATETDNIQEDLMSRLDSAVSEVFEMMLNRNCAPLDTQVDIDERVTARIRFSGSITGECLVYANQTVAQIAAEALLGLVSDPSDPMVDDAVGELCKHDRRRLEEQARPRFGGRPHLRANRHARFRAQSFLSSWHQLQPLLRVSRKCLRSLAGILDSTNHSTLRKTLPAQPRRTLWLSFGTHMLADQNCQRLSSLRGSGHFRELESPK
jgi:hypothetical protein